MKYLNKKVTFTRTVLEKKWLFFIPFYKTEKKIITVKCWLENRNEFNSWKINYNQIIELFLDAITEIAIKRKRK